VHSYRTKTRTRRRGSITFEVRVRVLHSSIAYCRSTRRRGTTGTSKSTSTSTSTGSKNKIASLLLHKTKTPVDCLPYGTNYDDLFAAGEERCIRRFCSSQQLQQNNNNKRNTIALYKHYYSLLFNPSIPHSCSNPKYKNTCIMSAYVCKKTVLRSEEK